MVFCFTAFLLALRAFAEPSLDIKIDQVGYPTALPKNAFITSEKAQGGFKVLKALDQTLALEGTLGDPVTDADSGDVLRLADFSALKKPGSYFLRVEGVGNSYFFQIGPDVYRDAFYLCMRAYYGQRCGIAVNLGPRFPECHHGACHLEDAQFDPSSGKKGKVQAVKGWHDAGDYGKYVVNSGIATGTLLWAYEWYQDRVKGIRLDLPESGNGIPDMLNEIKWNLDWMLTMQDSDGGVWHKLTDHRFCGFILPEQDSGSRFIIGTGKEPYKGTAATADFAAVMAIAARVYRPFLPGYADTCLKASVKAWHWAAAHPDAAFTQNPPGISTGGYVDSDCGDELLWASAELFRTAGEGDYNRYFLKHYKLYPVSDNRPPDWAHVEDLGLWAYYFSRRKNADAAALAEIKTQTLEAAGEISNRTWTNGYHNSLLTRNYIWGSNAVAGNYGILLLMANAMSPNPVFQKAALENLHYLFGRNTFGLCFVTRLGSYSVQHPHHRPSAAIKPPKAWPGLLAGGPNQYPQDPALQRMKPGPPARSYTDERESYASNEVAINWNAPLVFLLAGTLPGSNMEDTTKSPKPGNPQ